MLKSLTIKNFKSFKNTTLELSPFTLMIGANASGKSNALEMFQLIKWFLNPSAQKNDDNLQGLYCRGSKSALLANECCTLECTCRFETVASQEKFEFTIVRNDSDTIIRDSRYTRVNNTVRKDADVKVAAFVPTLEQITSITKDNTIFEEYFIDYLKEYGEFEKYKDNIIEILRTTWILDVIPAKMRNYSNKIFYKNFDVHGDNLSSIVFNLCQNEEKKKILLDCIQSLPEQNITDIAFIEVTERNEVMLKLEETFGSHKHFYDASLLSDGTLRVLAIVSFLLSAPEGHIAIIEEIDNGIHPSRIKDFMGKMSALAEKRNIQVLMTSHNPALLDAIPNDKLEDVVCCYRDKEEGDSRFVRLGDLYLYPELVAQGSLGELVTQGIVDRYVHDTRTPEDIVSQRVAWLEEFKAKQEALNA